MADFTLDHEEAGHIDNHPTAYQTRYGQPRWDEVPWHGYETNWASNIQQLDKNIYGEQDKMKTTFEQPREVKTVSKKDKQVVSSDTIRPVK